jgi:hypothetical protein
VAIGEDHVLRTEAPSCDLLAGVDILVHCRAKRNHETVRFPVQRHTHTTIVAINACAVELRMRRAVPA